MGIREPETTYRRLMRQVLSGTDAGAGLLRCLEFVASELAAARVAVWVRDGTRVAAAYEVGSPCAEPPPAVAEALQRLSVHRIDRTMAAPLSGARGCPGAAGALEVVRPADGPLFTESDELLVEGLSDVVAFLWHQDRLQRALQAKTQRLQVLAEVSREITSSLRTDAVLERIMRSITRVMQAEAGSILLLDPARQELAFEVAIGGESDTAKTVRVPVEGSIAGLAIKNRAPVVVDDAAADPRHFKKVDETSGYVTRSLVAVPLIFNENPLGVVEALNRKRDGGTTSHGAFSPEDVELFSAFAAQAAVAISNARLNDALEARARELREPLVQLEASYDATLHALTAALDLRDRETAGHSERVTAYTLELAHAIGISDPATLTRIRRGALLHDIGKIGVPDAVLHKPGPLSEQEWVIMRRHPQLGYRILQGIPFLRDAGEIVLCHHERWDGSGYPQGLRGEAIPLPARLFAVADTLDAITSDRPYRQAQPLEKARGVIAGESGTQFDPNVVEAFLAIPLRRWKEIRAATLPALERDGEASA